MAKYFAYDCTGEPFIFLGVTHIGVLAAIFMLNIILLRFRHKPAPVRRQVAIIMTVILLLGEAA